MIYLDHSATSYFKNDGVAQALFDSTHTANAGRSGYGPAIEATQKIFESRDTLKRFFNLKDSHELVFNSGCTEALNIAIQSFISRKTKITFITTNLEHNASARLLNHLKNLKLIDWYPLDSISGNFHESLQNHLKSHVDDSQTVIVLNHVSNVTGVRQNLEEIIFLSKKFNIPLIVDAAQSLGLEEIPINEIDIVCGSAHKGLKGPMGVGLLFTNIKYPLNPLLYGGTGSLSEKLDMPDYYPDSLEAGSPNIHGIHALKSAIDHNSNDFSVKKTKLQERRSYIYNFLKSISELQLYGPEEGGSAISFTTPNYDIGEVAHQLWKENQICLRAGLQCSPLAHQSIGSFPQGTLRVSPSPETNFDEIKVFLKTLKRLLN